MPKKVTIGLVLLATLTAFFVIFFAKKSEKTPILPTGAKFELKKFSSVSEFKNYLSQANKIALDSLGFLGRGGLMLETGDVALAPSEKTQDIERVSETNVQVRGIDEPDILKTDGKKIFFSSSAVYPIFERGIDLVPPLFDRGGVKIFNAFPPADLKQESQLQESGDLLLTKNILTVFANQKIVGYDVSNSQNPRQAWKIDLESNNQIVSSRLFQNKIYLVTKTHATISEPCPIRPLKSLIIPCTEIYHPVSAVPVDSTFTAMVINPETGQVEKNISFLGSSSTSILYMSQNALYLTYSLIGDQTQILYNFFSSEAKNLVSQEFIDKLAKLSSYDISKAAKLFEIQNILQTFYNSLSDNERLRVENEINNLLKDYAKAHSRDLEKTAIVKIDLTNFANISTGQIPGQPLNQFSIDEYQESLRVATTVGRIGILGVTTESTNDVYILNQSLKIIAEITDLGVSERIYSVRFMGDKGYLVTFKQVDPFFVLDLSNPQKPALTGELKIPGYSSYLHPVGVNLILGVGKEESQVKLSLFNIESAHNPKEVSKYNLNEYWSEILTTHHAFLHDEETKIFFMPGANAGYVFSYAGDKLSLIKAIDNIMAKRALFINNYLYIVGDNKIIILDETNWESVKEVIISGY